MQYDSDRLNTLSNAEYWMNSAVRNRRYISPALSYFEKCIVMTSVNLECLIIAYILIIFQMKGSFLQIPVKWVEI